MNFPAFLAMAPENEDEGVRDMFVDDVCVFLPDGLNELSFGGAVHA